MVLHVRAAAVAALLVGSVLVVLHASAPLHAQSGGGGAVAARMVWIAESGGLVALDAGDASVRLEVSEPAGVRTVAADEARGRVWAYSPGVLRAHRFDGTVELSVPVPPPPGYTEATPVRLAVHAGDGSGWLGVGASLRRFDAEGRLLVSLTLAEEVRALVLDAARSRLWAGTATSLEAYDDAGQVVRTVAHGRETLDDLAFDPDRERLWAALATRLRRYDPEGVLQMDVPLPVPLRNTRKWLAQDGSGGSWVASATQLVRVDASGLPAVVLNPWPGSGPIVAVTADTVDQSAWVASATTATRVSAAGELTAAVPLWGGLTIDDLAFARDLAPPALRFTAPLDGAALGTGLPALEVAYGDQGAGVDPATLAFTADGAALAVSCASRTDTAASCTPASALADGAHTLGTTIEDRAGNLSAPVEVAVTVDTVPPAVTLTVPADGRLTNQPAQPVAGEVSEAATLVVRLNGAAVESLAVTVGPFTASPVTLTEGGNLVEVVALDAAGHTGQAQAAVTLDTAAPAAVAAAALVGGEVTAGELTLEAAAGSVEPGATVTVTNARTGQVVTVQADANGGFRVTLAAQDGDPLSIVVTDQAGNASGPTRLAAGLPADPAAVAPAVDPTVATDLAGATAFLYEGASPIQTGVAAGTIEARRVAVLRGVVQARDGGPLPGVTVTILDHPEYGRTLSRADGVFDLAVNGGGVLTVRYAKAGFLPAQRQVQAPWQDYAWLPEVVLIPLDPQVTVVDLSGTAPLQVARGSVVTDADGTRQATVLVPAGTTAALVLADGTRQPAATLSVRATEYTVGATGPRAMPGELPPTSGYTYAVELGADEALAAGATRVELSQPVPVYVENFLGFPVGGAVPAGYYDRERAAWVPSKNGRVVRILSVTGSLAELDVDGSGVAADAAALAALGVTDAERARLATLYAVGQSLWRVPIPHFTPWDCNWPYGPPDDATPPEQPPTETDRPVDEPTCSEGSVIECESQILGEVVPIAGTPFELQYRSDRVPGRQTASRLEIPVTGASVPASLKRVELEIEVAGRLFTATLGATPGQTHVFV